MQRTSTFLGRSSGTALLLVFLLVAGSTTATWWWPTQGAWVETAHVTANDAHEDGDWENPSHWGVHFGSTVAIDGDTFAVGSQYDLHRDGPGPSDWDGGDWIYVFEKNQEGRWKQVAKLVPSDAAQGDTFSWSLDIDSESGTIVAGNPAAEKIYVFERTDNGSWVETATFTPPKEATKSYAFYGYTVAVNGKTVVTAWDPHLYIYEKVDGEWTEAGTLPGSTYVDFEGDTLLSSVWDADRHRRQYALYSQGDHGWKKVASLEPASRFDDHELGGTESTLGCMARLNEQSTVLVIGACVDRRIYGVPSEQKVQGLSISGGAMGSAWIYERIDGEWVFTADLPNPDPAPGGADYFGLSVDASGERVVVGSPFDNYNGGRDGDGAAYVYRKTEDDWSLTAKLRNHDNGPYGGKDVFGRSVGISGETIVAGAPFDDQRRDGTPFPADDDGDIPPCVAIPGEEIVWGCDEGEMAGSVYVFESPSLPPGDLRGSSGHRDTVP